MSETKPILAIETSGSLCGASVYFSGEKFFSVNFEYKNIHAEKIFEITDYVLNSADVKLKDLEAVAISSGPGSFTGLRIGMSAAKGMAYGASIPIIPVPTFEALALQLSSLLPDGTIFSIANRINVEEVYFAKFQIILNNFIFVNDLQIIHKNALIDNIQDSLVFGNAIDSKRISAPSPEFVAKWAKLNESKEIVDFDYLEPNYIKNFKI